MYYILGCYEFIHQSRCVTLVPVDRYNGISDLVRSPFRTRKINSQVLVAGTNFARRYVAARHTPGSYGQNTGVNIKVLKNELIRYSWLQDRTDSLSARPSLSQIDVQSCTIGFFYVFWPAASERGKSKNVSVKSSKQFNCLNYTKINTINVR